MYFIISICVTVLTQALLGIFVFLRNPKSFINRIFFGLTLAIIGWIVTLFIYYTVTDPGLVLLTGRMNFAVAIYIGLFFFLFAYYFPIVSVTISKKVPVIATVLTVLISLITQLTALVDKSEIIVGVEREVEYGPLYTTYIGLLLLFIIGGIVFQAIKVWRLEGRNRSQVRFVLVGFCLFFITAMTTNFVFPYYFSYYDLQVFAPVATIFITGFASVAISRHKLFDVRAITLRAVTYVILVALFGFIYAGTLFILGTKFISFREPNVLLLVATFLALFVGFTFQPLRRIVARITNSLLYKQDYELEKVVLKLSQQMNATLEQDALIHDALGRLQDVINSTTVQMYIHKKDSSERITAHSNKGSQIIPIKEEDLIRLHSEERILFADDFVAENGIKKIFQDHEISVFIPLSNKNIPLGCLLLGPKASGEIYYDKDVQLLHIFTPEFTLAVKNSQQYDEIKRFNETLQDEIKRATEKLQQANEHLKELDKMKDEFLSVASHDLRTPMTAIKGYLWLMMKKVSLFSPDETEKLHRIYNSTERLIALINDMLDISRIEGGRMEIVHEHFAILDTIHDVEQELLGQAAERKLTIIVKPGNFSVHADRNRTHEVLVNLIGNALKFTPEGGTVTVSCEDIGSAIATSVTDTGIGIKPENIHYLFKKFGRIDTSDRLQTQVPGTGLGLYICKKIIELSGGKITVESTIGKGTTFMFTLPKSG